MSQAIMNKAQELADLIGNCDELTAMRDAEVEMYNDSSAQALIDEFQKVQQEFQNVYAQGKDLSDEQKQLANEIEAKMEGHAAISKFIQAQQNFEDLLNSVNLIIGRVISGETEESGCSSCGGGCDSGCSC